jgi:hypothetical protein
VTIQEYVDAIHSMILNDQRISAGTLAISCERVGYIIYEILDMRKFSAKWVPISSLLFLAGACTFLNNNITPATSYYHTPDILPLTDSTLLPADMISLSTIKGLSLTDKQPSHFHRKTCYHQLVQYNCFTYVLLLSSMNLTYIESWHSKYKTSCQFYIIPKNLSKSGTLCNIS